MGEVEDGQQQRFQRWLRIVTILGLGALLAMLATGLVAAAGLGAFNIEIAAGVAVALLVIGGIVRAVVRWRFERFWRARGLTEAQVQSKWVTWGGKGG